MAENAVVVKVTVDASEALATLQRLADALDAPLPDGPSRQDALVENLARVWTVAGPSPVTHNATKEHLAVIWPSLYKAVSDLVGFHDQERRRG